jgi:Cof subfamily protein (haloacid dehalogenase superfamily)
MIAKIRALIVDIDGTLVAKGGEIMPLTKQALIALHDRGVLIGLASGGPVDDYMRRYPSYWKLPFDFDILIGMNGGHLWDRFHEGVQEFYPLSTDTLHQIVDLMAPLDLNPQIYENSQLIAARWDDLVAASAVRNMQEVVISPFKDRMYRHPNEKIQFRYPPEDQAKVNAFIDQLTLPDHITTVRTSPGIVEFLDDRVNKGIAVEHFAKRNDIPITEIMTFGDMENDEQLTAKAGWGVALCNGCEATKKAADDVTTHPVDDNGIGHYLYDHIIDHII